jgi:aryl-phospho-beta-D-glucosidase BglC (GH1 family)
MAKMPVTILANARAVVPPEDHEMRRFTGRSTPAHRAAKKFLRGTNLGNYLEAPPGQDWGAKYTEADFVHIKAEGFDHVRLPIAWHHCAGPAPEFRLSDDIYDKADYGRPVHVGEFGCYTGADAPSRARFYAEFRKVLDDFGLGWAMWDWKAGFRYWDDKTGQPAPGMREALFAR